MPVVGALYWRRATGAGALAPLVVGSGVALVLIFTQGILANSPIIFGLLASLLTFVLVSLITDRPSPEKLDAWEHPAWVADGASRRLPYVNWPAGAW